MKYAGFVNLTPEDAPQFEADLKAAIESYDLSGFTIKGTNIYFNDVLIGAAWSHYVKKYNAVSFIGKPHLVHVAYCDRLYQALLAIISHTAQHIRDERASEGEDNRR